MFAYNLRKASTFCILAVTAGYLNSKTSTSCRGTIPTIALRSTGPELTTMNAGLMDMFKSVSGSNRGTWSAVEFQRMVQAIESSAATSIDIVPTWDSLDRMLRDQESAAEREAYDVMLSGTCISYKDLMPEVRTEEQSLFFI